MVSRELHDIYTTSKISYMFEINWFCSLHDKTAKQMSKKCWCSCSYLLTTQALKVFFLSRNEIKIINSNNILYNNSIIFHYVSYVISFYQLVQLGQNFQESFIFKNGLEYRCCKISWCGCFEDIEAWCSSGKTPRCSLLFPNTL